MTMLRAVATILLQVASLAWAGDLPESYLDPRRVDDAGVRFLVSGDYPAARAFYRNMLRDAEAKGSYAESLGLALVRLGSTEYLAGRPKASLQYFERAAEVWAKNPDWQASALEDAAQAQVAMGQWTRAEKTLRRAIEVAPRRGRAWHVMGQVLYLTGRPREAEIAYRDALKFADPENPTQTAGTLSDLATVLEGMGQYAEAIGLAERAVEVAAGGLVHRRMIGNLGRMYWRSGQRERGLQYVQRALAEADTGSEKGRRAAGELRATLAGMLKDLGRKKEAKAVEAGMASGLR